MPLNKTRCSHLEIYTWLLLKCTQIARWTFDFRQNSVCQTSVNNDLNVYASNSLLAIKFSPSMYTLKLNFKCMTISRVSHFKRYLNRSRLIEYGWQIVPEIRQCNLLSFHFIGLMLMRKTECKRVMKIILKNKSVSTLSHIFRYSWLYLLAVAILILTCFFLRRRQTKIHAQ